VADNNKINSTTYNIQDKWLNNIAPKYFVVDDINMLRAGLFGYVNEITSNSVEDSVNAMNVISNEIYPNKAVFPNSIYAYSALADFDDFDAKPAKVNFTLAIKLNSLWESKLNENTDNTRTGIRTIKINRNSILKVEDKFNFTLPYDLFINIKKSDKDQDINNSGYYTSVRYDFESVDNPFIEEGSVSNYLPTKQLNISEGEGYEWYLFIYLIGFQAERKEYEFLVTNEDLVSNIKYNVNYQGNIASFNVWYYGINPDGTEAEPVQLSKYYVDSIKPSDEKFCFYEYTSSTSFSIIFAAHPNYFKPVYNSKIVVELYTTAGEDGNFEYEGEDVDFAFFTENDEEVSEYSKLYHYAFLSGNSYGGTNAMDIEEIKYNSIKAFSVRKNIITENDLDYYFANITQNSRIKFIKKRDDLIRRIYSAFLLLRNAKKEIIPTFTGNLYLNVNQFDNYREDILPTILSFKAGKYIAEYGIIDDWKYYTSIPENNESDGFKYTNPFLMKVNTNPYFVSYYLNSVFDNYGLLFNYINNEIMDEFVANSINVYRNAMKDNIYNVSFNLNIGSGFESFVYYDETTREIYEEKPAGYEEKPYDLKIVYFVKNKVTEDYLGYFYGIPLRVSDDDLFIEVEGNIKTSDYINENDCISIINSLYSVDTRIETLNEEVPVPSDNIVIELGIFVKGYTKEDGTPITDKSGIKVNMPSVFDDYCLNTLFLTNKDVSLFKDVNNIMYSTLIFDTDEFGNEDANLFKIKSVPLLRYDYLKDEDRLKEFINLLDFLRQELQGTLNFIENNFDIDMKFYNTYGESEYFTIGREKLPLGSTNISINLVIKLNTELTESIKNEIQSFITEYVESINVINAIEYIYVSDLIRRMTETFEYIVYIEFLGFNGMDSSLQIIENNYTDFNKLSNKQIIKYVPEYVNINKVLSYDESGKAIFTPDINIEYIV